MVASVDALMHRLMPLASFQQACLTLELGQRVEPKSLMEHLIRAGYERVERVDVKGQCALRGGILDVYPPDAVEALRVEFFDDEVDSLRSFQTDTQRSQGKLTQARIAPACETLLDKAQAEHASSRLEQALGKALTHRGYRLTGPRVSAPEDELPSLENMRTGPQLVTRPGTNDARLSEYIARIAEQWRDGAYPLGMEQFMPFLYERPESIFDWMPDALVIFDEPDKLRDRMINRYDAFVEMFKNALERGEALGEQVELLLNADAILHQATVRGSVLFSAFLRTTAGMRPEVLVKLEGVGATGYQGQLRELIADTRKWMDEGWRIALLSGGVARGKRLQQSLEEHRLPTAFEDAPGALRPGVPTIVPMSLSHGFLYPAIRLAVVADADLYGAALRKARAVKKAGERIAAFTDLKVGDYVVHETHGVGRYEGTVRLQSEGRWRDYLFIQYQESDKLYVPTDQMDRVQRYIGGEGAAPRLNRLGGNEWNRQKQKVKQSLREMAFDLVKLYAQRSTIKGFAFSPDTAWQREFEDNFPYEETPDQLQAVQDIKQDMERSMPMDRLLCGDVGYGKTEVALRAAFKAVMDGKQVAFLAPTTILTQQHFHTIQERFKGFPMRAEFISRFKTATEQREILHRLHNGEIDILVGTHRMLAKDVHFKSLGLLIVDEEQRFGVQHKESIKNLKNTIDVLTLSATPIPRTLHMSMVGIRDMSLLETPPEERYPVQTYVLEYSDGLVRDAILRELARGGQIYLLYNRVESIERFYEQLRELVPEARIAIGHGQMREHMLEDVMMDFYEGRFDVLLCTTIIESGLDVPKANTLIVYDADYFGLSQLYQLRGRVGRSNRLAYAYLTLRPDKVLSETADKRLQAIREFTEFGSGFRIAMRDLEIRGAGNLLGAEQHGFLSTVGYDMYCKLLEETVRELRGEMGETEAIETRVEFHVDAYLPAEYVHDDQQRMEIYKRIAACENRSQREDLEEEMVDRFGDLPEQVLALMDIALLKALVNHLGVDLISYSMAQVRMRFAAAAKPDLARLVPALQEADKRLILSAGTSPSLILRDAKLPALPMLRETLRVMERVQELMRKTA